jgi:fucose permease
VGGWAAEFARRMAHASADPSGAVWGYAPTAFWALQTTGRLLAPLALAFVSEQFLLLASLGLAGLAVAGLAFATTTAGGAVAGAAAAGLGLAAIFPVVLAGATRDIAPRLPAAMGPLFAAGGVGGAVLPWMVGVVSAATGSLQAGLLVPLAALGAIIGLVIGLGPAPTPRQR